MCTEKGHNIEQDDLTMTFMIYRKLIEIYYNVKNL